MWTWIQHWLLCVCFYEWVTLGCGMCLCVIVSLHITVHVFLSHTIPLHVCSFYPVSSPLFAYLSSSLTQPLFWDSAWSVFRVRKENINVRGKKNQLWPLVTVYDHYNCWVISSKIMKEYNLYAYQYNIIITWPKSKHIGDLNQGSKQVLWEKYIWWFNESWPVLKVGLKIWKYRNNTALPYSDHELRYDCRIVLRLLTKSESGSSNLKLYFLSNSSCSSRILSSSEKSSSPSPSLFSSSSSSVSSSSSSSSILKPLLLDENMKIQFQIYKRKCSRRTYK